GIVELGKSVGDLLAIDEKLEALGDVGVAVLAPRERRNLGGKIDDEGRLDELLFRDRLEEHQLQRAPALVAAEFHAALAQPGREKVAVAQLRRAPVFGLGVTLDR